MKKELVILFVVLAVSCMACAQLKVNLKWPDNSEIKYHIPFKKGYVYNDNGTLKILLIFYDNGSWFATDTSETLHLYIYGKEEAFKNSGLSNKIKAFFIKVHMWSTYGFMKINNLQLMHNKKGKMYITGHLNSGKILRLRELERELDLKFTNLPLIQVSSFEDIYNKEIDYFKKVLQENFSDVWHQ